MSKSIIVSCFNLDHITSRGKVLLILYCSCVWECFFEYFGLMELNECSGFHGGYFSDRAPTRSLFMELFIKLNLYITPCSIVVIFYFRKQSSFSSEKYLDFNLAVLAPDDKHSEALISKRFHFWPVNDTHLHSSYTPYQFTTQTNSALSSVSTLGV